MIRFTFFVAALAGAAIGLQAKDSHTLFLYSTDKGDSGLQVVAVDSALNVIGRPVGDMRLTNSDFGAWGAHKKMYEPTLVRSPRGWELTFRVTPDGDVWAHTSSPDLLAWQVQEYDTTPSSISATAAVIDGQPTHGTVVELSDGELSVLCRAWQSAGERDALHGELMRDDAARFPRRDTVAMELAWGGEPYAISDKLIGIFFEDINYAADGGLSAQLLQNRDFEYTPADRGGDKRWNATRAWMLGGDLAIDTAGAVTANNPHHVLAHLSSTPVTLENGGFDGISLTKGQEYRVGFMLGGVSRSLRAKAVIVDSLGNTVQSVNIPVKVKSQGWNNISTVFKCRRDVKGGSLRFEFTGRGDCRLDMFTLMPVATFNGRQNGLRRDLAQVLADLKPRFVRFPGGCVSHGDGVDNIYDWKGSVGPVEQRRPLRNLWGYHQSRAIGFMEYFTFCEDIGAEPLPVLAAGVPCQNSSTPSHHSHDLLTSCGQQCGIPLGDEMDAYIADILDLIEWANGDTITLWGAERARQGHPAPFNLKMLGIGNEDLISEAFIVRFNMIADAVQARYPDIKIVGTAGPFNEGADYRRGWELARDKGLPLIDEHYYVSPGWFIHNRGFYDSYPRGGTQVYLGEYASHMPGRESNLEAALSIALYLTDIERNGDVVAMTSYAPLLARKHHTQWRPDLIYFDNDSIYLTPDYHVQYLYGNNAGTMYRPAKASLSTDDPAVACRLGHSVTVDALTGDTIVKLANLTPMAVKTSLPLRGEATVTVLAGAPSDTDCTPRVSTSTIGDGFVQEPYSFTVLRFAKTPSHINVNAGV